MADQADLISRVRRKIADIETEISAISVKVDSRGASKATVKITSDGYFVTSVIGGSIVDLNYSLADVNYDTLGELVLAINSVDGYLAQRNRKVFSSTSSLELIPVEELDCLGKDAFLFTKHLFEDAVYLQAINDALNVFNDGEYQIATLPAKYEYLIVFLASAFMAQLRSAEELDEFSSVSNEEGEGLHGSSYSTSGGDLSISESGLDSPFKSWLELASEYKERYFEGAGRGHVVDSQLIIWDRLHQVFKPRGVVLAPTKMVLSGSVSGSDVTLLWQKISDYDFLKHEIYRSQSSGVTRDNDLIKVVSDPRVIEYVDTGLSSGSYFYKMWTWNTSTVVSSDLLVQSNEIEVTVL